MALNWMRESMKLNFTIVIARNIGGQRLPVWFMRKNLSKTRKAMSCRGLYNVWIRLITLPVQLLHHGDGKGCHRRYGECLTDRSIVAVIFTGTGPYAFCTGGNTKNIQSITACDPKSMGLYGTLNNMVDAILMCKKPVICRVNGMRVAGGQEIGTACISQSPPTLLFSARQALAMDQPLWGVLRLPPLVLEHRRCDWSCISCEMWSAYKMCGRGLITKCFPFSKMTKANGAQPADHYRWPT